jgi:hypothetical protein
VGAARTAGAADAAGRFALPMATGDNTLAVIAPGYHLVSDSHLYVAGNGQAGVAVTVARTPGYLVRFTTRHPDGFFGATVQVRTAAGRILTARASLGIRSDGWWFAPVGDLGDRIELRVLRDGDEVVPWTALSSDPAQRPAAIEIGTLPAIYHLARLGSSTPPSCLPTPAPSRNGEGR